MGKNSTHNPECKNIYLNNLYIMDIVTWLEISTLFIEGAGGEGVVNPWHWLSFLSFSIVIATWLQDYEKIVEFFFRLTGCNGELGIMQHPLPLSIPSLQTTPSVGAPDEASLYSTPFPLPSGSSSVMSAYHLGWLEIHPVELSAYPFKKCWLMIWWRCWQHWGRSSWQWRRSREWRGFIRSITEGVVGGKGLTGVEGIAFYLVLCCSKLNEE